MLKRKSIVLSDVAEKSNKKAVLTIEEVESGLKGLVRLYNFDRELEGISSLGFYIDKKVYKAGLTYKSFMLYEFFIDLNQFPTKFSCAVVNFQNAIATPILFGTSEGNQDNIYGNIVAEIARDNSLQNATKVLDQHSVGFDEEEQQEIEKQIDKECDKCDCEACVYKKYFLEHNQEKTTTQSTEMEASSTNETKEGEIEFFQRLKPQIDKLFEKFPSETNLQRLMPDSKWVKVDYEDDGDFYVFGLLYDPLGQVKYVCYGVPAIYEENPPEELSGFPVWLPLDKENDSRFGYWLTYQDASTGEPVKTVVD